MTYTREELYDGLHTKNLYSFHNTALLFFVDIPVDLIARQAELAENSALNSSRPEQNRLSPAEVVKDALRAARFRNYPAGR
jgi:hypothetical protein